MAATLMRRGQIVVVSAPGDYGKPRPAIVLQSDLFAALPSVTLAPLTSQIREDADQFRLSVEPSGGNGLREVSQVMIDKITTVARERIGQVIGEADDALMLRINRALALFLSVV